MECKEVNTESNRRQSPRGDELAARPPLANADAMVMTPSLGLRFSGINATMEAVTPVLRRSIKIACCGCRLSDQMPTVGLLRWLRSTNRRRWRIWHARRNNDMLVGLILRHVFRQKLILVWTSAAQRHHSWITRACYSRMDTVVATTSKAAGFVRRATEVSHHGVNTHLYQPAADKSDIRRELALENCQTIGVFGRVRPQKGTGDLVDALVHVLPRYPGWQVIFVGQVTPEFTDYRNRQLGKLRAAGLDDRVRFLGFVQDLEELPRWYQAMDVVACVSRTEGFGVTCLEAMSSGVPVLATDAGAWPEIIEPGRDGWLANRSDPDDLARSLHLAFQTEPERLRQMGIAARVKMEQRFSIQREADRLIDLYDRLFAEFGENNWSSDNCQPGETAA